MIHSQWLRSPSQGTDLTAQRLRTLHTLLLAGCAILFVALAASIAIQPTEWRGHGTYVGMLVEHLIVLAITRRGRLRTAVLVHVACYTFVVLATMVAYGGVRTPAGLVLPPIVMLVGLTWSARAAFVSAITIAAALLVLVILETQGALATDNAPPLTPMILWIVTTGTLVITAVMLQVALGIIRRSREEAAAQEQERRVLEEKLAQSRRLEAVGRLAAGVAHDFSNVLQVIYAYSDQISNHSDPAVARAGRTSLDAAQHAAALTRQLLAFGRRQVVDPKVVDLNQVLKKLEKLARGFVGEDVVLSFQYSSEPARVRADETQLEQVMMNLLANARDALPNGGRVAVRTAVGADDVALFVEDNGIGMNQEVVAHLFEPFFTTKEQGRGTGLGLATVHAIVDQCKGRIEVESKPGDGARFKVVFPMARESESKIAMRSAVASASRDARVLLVDDDELVRTAVAAVLKKSGHHVTSAGSGAEAMRAVAVMEEPPTLLVTDVVMPEMTGPELARRLRERFPQMRVLFMSGYAHEHMSVRGVLTQGVHFIAKPFEPSALLQRIDAVLAARNPGALPAQSGAGTAAD